MTLGTLEEFLVDPHRRPPNAYVRHNGFRRLYVRWSQRSLGGTVYKSILDIANIEATKPGKGAFTKLVEDLHARNISLYVESVMNTRFEAKLLRMGFTQRPEQLGAPSFYLLVK